MLLLWLAKLPYTLPAIGSMVSAPLVRWADSRTPHVEIPIFCLIPRIGKHRFGNYLQRDCLRHAAEALPQTWNGNKQTHSPP